MNASVLVVCMPSIAKFLKFCYVNLTEFTARHMSDPAASDMTPPAHAFVREKTPAAKSKRGVVSRMLYALDNMTTGARTKRTQNGHGGSVSSRISFARIPPTSQYSMGDTVVDRNAPECTNYVKFYGQYAKQTSQSRSVELRDIELGRNYRP